MGKECAFSLVERGGRVRSFHVKSVSAKNLGPILFAQVDRASTLMSDDAGQYRILGPEFAHHESVNHRIDEYVRGDAYTNTIEGYFSLLKRGVNGTYHHVRSEEHTSELQSLMRIPYAVFCLKKKNHINHRHT